HIFAMPALKGRPNLMMPAAGIGSSAAGKGSALLERAATFTGLRPRMCPRPLRWSLRGLRSSSACRSARWAATHTPDMARKTFRFVEPLDLPHVVRSRPYNPLGRNPYLWHRAVDESVSVPVEPPTPPTGPRGRGRTKAWSPLSEAFERSAATSLHYYFHRAHESAPGVAPTFAAFFVRVPFRPLGRSRYLYHFAQDTSAAGPAFNPGWAVNVNKVFNARRVGGGVIV